MKTANGNIQRQDENDDRATGAALPLVAIVGRPNVGKSTLFNRIAGQRRAIVGDEPGITRDRIYSEADWLGRRFSVVDTGGIVPDDEALIPSNILKQAAEAIAEAQVLIWVVDVRKGITSLDEELAALLRATGKPVLIAANKADAAKLDAEAGEFYRFGFEGVFPVSAEQGIGVAEMLDETVKLFAESAPKLPKAETSEDRQIKLAIVGRPNVGKSSLLNKLIGAERAIVSPEAGTTRDSVDAVLKSDGKAFRIIDTAGIRRKGKTREMAEKLSVVMARKALEQADVAVVIVDAIEGFTALDATIASYAIESGCSVIFAVNKWDAVEGKSTNTALEFERTLRARAKSFAFAPVITISALTGQRVDRILTLVAKANEARNRRIPTAQLNSFFEKEVRQPSGAGSAKVLYMTQVGVRPPKFVLFTSGRKGGLHFSYERYLQNRLREEFDFFATPLRIVERHRKQK